MISLHLKLVDENGDVMGDAIAQDDPRFLPDGEMRALHLSWLGVSEAHRRKGIATSLFGAVRGYATGRYDFVFGWHAGANSAIRACLLKCGWVLPDEDDTVEQHWPWIHILPISAKGYDIPESVLDQLQAEASARNARGE